MKNQTLSLFDAAPNGLCRLTRFRAAPSAVDAERHVLRGMSVIEAVEALGHGMLVDARTLEQVAEFGNASVGGVKSRYTHPGLSADGLGRHLGRMHAFRVEGTRVLADLHFAQSAASSPEGDLRAYVEELAAEDPEAAGLSIVAYMTAAWKIANEDGAEVEVIGNSRPDNATTKIPFARLDWVDLRGGERINPLRAVDLVDEPAANRAGMFSASTTNVLARDAFARIDEWLAEHDGDEDGLMEAALSFAEDRGIEVEKVPGFLAAHSRWREAHPTAAQLQNFSASSDDAGETRTNNKQGNMMENNTELPAPKTYTEAELKLAAEAAVTEALKKEREEREKSEAAERDRVKSISELGNAHDLAEAANEAIADGESLDAFKDGVIAELAKRADELTKQLAKVSGKSPARAALTGDPEGKSDVDALLEQLHATNDPKDRYRITKRLMEARKAAAESV